MSAQSLQRKVARPETAKLPVSIASGRVQAASIASVAEADSGGLNTEINTIRARLDAAAIP